MTGWEWSSSGTNTDIIRSNTDTTSFSSDGQISIVGELDVKLFSNETIQALKNALGYGDVIIKCGHCGQWGAIKTACKHCGAAVG